MINLHSDTTYTVSDVDDILKIALTKGTCKNNKKIRYHNIICAFDIETTSFTDDIDIDDSYKDLFLYNYLKGSTIKCPDIEYLPKVKGIKLSHDKGYNLDELYADLCDIYPYLFDDSITDPDKQLQNIIDQYEINTPIDLDSGKHAIMYIWQFAIDGHVIIGRTWSEFIELMDKLATLCEDARIIIWVHSLAFEFQWIRKLFNWKKVFSISPRKPIYAITDTNIEFRCSYILTNYNLETLAKQLQYYDIRKLVGDLDYSLYRSPETPLKEDTELKYCINDVLIVSAYIQECIFKEKYICNIPLTATGYCRRYCRKMCFNNKNSKQYKQYRGLMNSLKITGKEEYEQLKRAFAGGFTHASAIWSGRTISADKYGFISSIDFTSSYPYVLLSERRFPMSTGKIVKIKTKEEFYNYLQYYCCIFDIEFKNIRAKTVNENYISTSHCYKSEKVIANNGRLVSADSITTTITELDYKIIDTVYDFDEINVYNFRVYKRDYLPKELIQAIIKLYKDKTVLKGVKGKEQEYLNSKALLNSTFGMFCTDICRDEIIYSDSWDIESCDIEKTLIKYNNSTNRFSFYPWGIYTCSLARYNLWSGILEFGDDYIYSDTDSIKCLNIDKHMDYINSYNALCKRKLQAMCKHYDLNYDDLEPMTIDGVKKPLGVWDIESYNSITCFKTLGAKRYMYIEDNELHLTCAGVNKKKAIPYLIKTYGKDVFKKFDFGLHIPAEYTGKMTHCYIDQEQSGVITDYLGHKYNYVSLSGIYLEKQPFDFKINADYLEYLKGVQYYK